MNQNKTQVNDETINEFICLKKQVPNTINFCN